MLTHLSRRKATLVRSLFPGRHLGCSLELAGSRGVSPQGTITFDCSAACMNWPLVLAVLLGSAGLRYVNVRQITCRERKPLSTKIKSGLSFLKKETLLPCVFHRTGDLPWPWWYLWPLSRPSEFGHCAVAKAESSLLALLLHLDALHLLSHSRVHFLFRVKTLEYKWSVLIDLKRLNLK